MEMKVTRSELKNVVKECLIEILQEGLLDTKKSISESRSQAQSSALQQIKKSISLPPRAESQQLAPKKFSTALDTPVGEQSRSIVPKLTKDPTLQSLLEDTARTTLGQQNAAETRKGPAAATDIPLDSLMQSEGLWAKLAFADAQPAAAVAASSVLSEIAKG